MHKDLQREPLERRFRLRVGRHPKSGSGGEPLARAGRPRREDGLAVGDERPGVGAGGQRAVKDPGREVDRSAEGRPCSSTLMSSESESEPPPCSSEPEPEPSSEPEPEPSEEPEPEPSEEWEPEREDRHMDRPPGARRLLE